MKNLKSRIISILIVMSMIATGTAPKKLKMITIKNVMNSNWSKKK